MEKLFSWKQHSKIAKVHNLKVKAINILEASCLILFIMAASIQF